MKDNAWLFLLSKMTLDHFPGQVVLTRIEPVTLNKDDFLRSIEG